MRRIVAFHPWLERQLPKLKADHLDLILKDFEKIEEQGKNALKILHVFGKYILAEVKHHRPPYRLYVVVDQDQEIYMLVDWSHKKEQQRKIQMLSTSIEAIVEEFMRAFSQQ